MDLPAKTWKEWDALCDAFESAWRAGSQPSCESILARVPEDQQPGLLTELLLVEFEQLQLAGKVPLLQNYLSRFSGYTSSVESAWQRHSANEHGDSKNSDCFNLLASNSSPDENTHSIEMDDSKQDTRPENGDLPSIERIGRFQIKKVLGQGGFGRVFLAKDPSLDRDVVLKIPRPDKDWSEEALKLFATEARTTSKLRGPGIVTVHDVFETQIGSRPSVCLVQEYIEGEILSDWLENHPRPLAHDRIAKLIADVAEILSPLHQQQYFHRDLKPGNILIDLREKPHVLDFGLALHVSERTQQSGNLSGSRSYMAPEQVRGETHRIDGRTDIWALGVMLYEMLSSKKPFEGPDTASVFGSIKFSDPQPLRQLDPTLSMELERICLKCLAKQMSDRYTTVADFVFDLRNWRETDNVFPNPRAEVSNTIAVPTDEPVVPKGLRSFDADDAGFFLGLLPGVRGRDGLPESIRFWKTRIESKDPSVAFPVGLLYGPSGCGKSSLMKAGLLPRLSGDVETIYLEATTDDTERALIASIRRRFDLPSTMSSSSLPDVFSEIRNGRILPRGKKLLIVIDQFEQWLFAHSDAVGQELLEALLHCDGVRVQAIVMVRDDFWMAATRFFRKLDIPLVERSNSASVDLFDVDHAERVLKVFGQAFGRLESDSKKDKQDHKQFIAEAVSGLAEQGKVISVRLSLFAEMMKSRHWTPESLRAVGGTTGLGATFLEETFSASGAPPQHRFHQEAARSVLRALLPEAGTDIKGHKRSTDELRAACRYGNRQRDFDDLIRILDGELRLITPVDSSEPPALAETNQLETQAIAATTIENPSTVTRLATAAQVGQSTTQYQLTHDYLVPSLRDWLTRKQRETRKGRAELKLAERSTLWNAKPENRYLPSLTEWLSIRTLTESKHWTAPQREVMKRAKWVHFLRSAVVAASLISIASAGVFVRGQVLLRQEATRIEGLVGTLLRAEPAQISEIVKELDGNQEVAASLLSPVVSADAKTVNEKRSQLHARLAMVSHDKSLVEPLLEELLTNKVTYIGPIRQQLRPYAGELTEKLRTILRDDKADFNRRFHAAVALADSVPESESASWTDADLQFVAWQLLLANSEFQPLLRENLRPISKRLLPDLEKIFGDAKSTDAQRLSAANSFADYAANDIEKLAKLLTVATPEQHTILYPLVATDPTPSTLEDLSKIAETLPPTEMGSAERIAYGQQRANSAVTLLRLGKREKVLPVFDMADDPEALTQFIFRCRNRGVRVDELLDLLSTTTRSVSEEPGRDAREHYALLLALGEYTLSEIPESSRDTLLKQLSDTYRNDPSSCVHGAAGWLLRQWGQTEAVREVEQTAVPYTPDREWFTLAISVTPTAPAPTKRAYDKAGIRTKNGQSIENEETKEPVADIAKSEPRKTFYYTFVVFPAGESKIGSISDESDRRKSEDLQNVTLTRRFAILDREITMEELIAYAPDYTRYMVQSDAKPSDAAYAVLWYDSVAFCRWLGAHAGIVEEGQSYASPEWLPTEDYPREPNPSANWAPRNWPIRLEQPGFRLPTDAEWEVASRGSVRTAYGFGGDASLLGRFGWFQQNSDKRVHPPRELRPSLRGLFDMHGNLFEWTHDWFRENESTAGVDPINSNGGSHRVSRGGSWISVAAYCRAANRHTHDPANNASFIGFRLALSLPVKLPEAEQ